MKCRNEWLIKRKRITARDIAEKFGMKDCTIIKFNDYDQYVEVEEDVTDEC